MKIENQPTGRAFFIKVSPLLAMLLIVILGSSLSALLARLQDDKHASAERGKVQTELAIVSATLNGHLEAAFNSASGLVDLVSLQGDIPLALFTDMARLAIEKSRFIRNITLAPNDTIAHVYPLAGNEKVLGFSYASNPEQYRTVQLARTERQPILAGPLNLIQGGRGLIQRMPIFTARHDAPGDTRYWGSASIVANADALFDALAFESHPDIRIALRDKDAKGSQSALIWGDPDVFDNQPVMLDIMIPGGSWQLGAIPAHGWQSGAPYRLQFVIFGSSLSLLLGLLAGQWINYGQMTRARNRQLETEILERQKVEEALRDEEQRFRILFESSPDPAWIIEDNQFSECNVAAANILGYKSVEAVLFVHPSKLSPEYQPDGESSYSKAERMMEMARSRGVHRFEWLHRRIDGSLLPAEVTLSTVTLRGKQMIYCVWRDITKRKGNEEKLKLAATVLATTAEGVLITDAHVRILSVNKGFTEITGYTEQEVIGHNPSLLQSERQGPEFYQSMWQTLAATDVWQGEIWNRRKNGEAYPEWLTISTIRDSLGAITNYVGVFSDISSLKHSQASLERLAHFDPLTDLPNRVLFLDRLAHALDRAQRYNHAVAILLLDLDGFKNVNDSHGHPVGDKLLAKVSVRLQECVRVEDTVARLGGDEFALILSNLRDGSDATDVIHKLLSHIEQPFDLDGVSAMISASIGIAVYPADGKMSTELVRNADTAMYDAKAGGRNTYRFYQAGMTLRAQERLQQEADLRRAVERDEFEVWFQPQLDLASGSLTGAEALLRWRDPQRGLVAPLDFIPLAESTGLIIPIGQQVLDMVCSSARRWLDEGLNFGRLAINVAAPQLERSDFVATIRQILAASSIPPDRLEIEITESLLMENAANVRDILLKIQSLGISTAVDDFGTGYSSLAYLKNLPIDNLKIDRAFVGDLPDNANDVAITRAIIAMAHSLGFKVIAEGIETEAQRSFLKQAGCDEGQGYLFGKPMPAAAFEAWLRQRTA